MTNETVFELLAELLKTHKLPCEKTPARIAEPDEFMLMSVTEDRIAFKHRETRNYLHLVRHGYWKIQIPNGGVMPNRMWFDAGMTIEELQILSALTGPSRNKPKSQVEYCVEVTLHTSIVIDTPRTSAGIDFDTGDKLAKLGIHAKYGYLGNISIEVVDHNTNPGGL